jgi:hypothetical protein
MNARFHFLKSILLLVLVSGSLLSSCARKTQTTALSPEHAKWMKSRVKDYRYEFQPRCYCIQAKRGPYTVVVKKNEIVSVNGQPYDPENMGRLFTIDGLFEMIESQRKRKPVLEEIEYDPQYGFPSSLYFDFVENIKDEEYGWYVSKFERIR